jgi:hypothetical protein
VTRDGNFKVKSKKAKGKSEEINFLNFALCLLPFALSSPSAFDRQKSGALC